MIRVLLLCCLLSLTARADVYVSLEGDDAADGATAATAVQSLDRASVLWSQQSRGTQLLFRRGDEWNASSYDLGFGQGGSDRGTSVVADYGDPSQPRPVLRGVSLRNAGSGLYECQIANIVFEGAGQSESRDCLSLRKVVGEVTISITNCDIRGYAKGANIAPHLDGRPTIRFTDCLIADCHSMGILTQSVGLLDLQRCVIRGCAFGTTPGVRTHNNRTHGVYASKCSSLTVDGCVFDDNGSMNLKCSSDSVNGCQPVSITDSTFVDGFFAIGLDASDVSIVPGGVRHRDVTITGNTFTRTRDINTPRRVDASTNSVTRDYWDKFVNVASAANCVITQNTVTAIAPELSDNPNSEAKWFVTFNNEQQENNQCGGNTLVNITEAEFRGEATPIVGPGPDPPPPLPIPAEPMVIEIDLHITGTIKIPQGG